LPPLETPAGSDAARLLGRLDANDAPAGRVGPASGFDALFGPGPRVRDAAEVEKDAAAGDRLRRQANDELALEEARGRATRVRARTAALREEIATIERECGTLRAAISDARSRAAARLAALARTETKRAALDRELAQTLAETEKVASRLTTLHTERRAVEGEVAVLADGTASVTETVTRVLRSQESHDP
jgi:chromosome segregation ATPase